MNDYLKYLRLIAFINATFKIIIIAAIIGLLYHLFSCSGIKQSNYGGSKFHRKHLNKVYVSCPTYH